MNAYAKVYNFSGQTIRALLECAAKNDVRYYLNGICFEFPRQRAAATDGHILAICKAPSWHDARVDFPEGGLIVHRDLLEQFKKATTLDFAFALRDAEQTNASKPADWVVTITADNGQTNSAPCIDGVFPVIDRVIPRSVSHEQGFFLPDMYEKLIRTGKQLSSKRDRVNFQLFHNGPHCAGIAEFGDDFFAVVMPARVESTTWQGIPEWCKHAEINALPSADPDRLVFTTIGGLATVKAA